MAWWQNFYHSAINQLALFGIADFIDIALVSYIVYKALKFIRDTRTLQLLKGVIVVIAITQISYFAKLNVMYYILSNFLQLGVIALFIVFQPELRRALEHTGRSANSKWFSPHTEFGAEQQQVIREVSRAAQAMSRTRTGALIVIETRDNIDSMISSGVRLSAKVTGELLENIFVPDTPLHDGAVVIRNCRAEIASCVLPLSKNPNINTSYGTRHRAGIGISEESDAISVIVSEETGRISVAHNGNLTTGYNEDTLRAKLIELTIGEGENQTDGKGKFKLPGLSKRRRG
ncbi:MAG: diadenylate cyclase CdaA [Clostridia bacterium]|nr:diadenylate cyclase CdaA [Clostridia bacterium]